MKKTLSVFLSFVMLLSCLCFGSITAQAANVKANNLTSLYDADTQTLYIKGKGKIPSYYMGLKYRELTGSFSEENYISDASITIRYPDGDIAEVITDPNDPRLQELMIRQTYPSWFVDITRHVKKLVIGEGITDIGTGAFYAAFDSLEKVVLPSTLKTIDDSALCNYSLKSIVIPASVSYLHDYFLRNYHGCDVTGDATIVIKGKNTHFQEDRKGDISLVNYKIYCMPGSRMEKQCKKYNKGKKAPYTIDYKVIKTPAQVSGVKASTTGSTVKLTWKKAKYANRYKVQRYVVSQKKWKTYATVTGTSYTFKNMAGSTNYRFRVIGVNRICDVDFSGKASKECKAKTKFGKVLGVKVSAKNGTLSVKWNAVREAKSYQVYYATKKDGSYKKLGTASGTSFKKKVTKGKTYYVKVRAVKKNSKGKTVYGAYSDVKSVYVDW